MSETEDLVACDLHGESPPTFVCRHVAGGVACGFHAKRPTKKNPWPDAWCDACEDLVQRTGRWTDATSRKAGITILCTTCYAAARDRNAEVPELARGKRTKLTKKETATLFQEAKHAAQYLQYTSDTKWHWSDRDHWDVQFESRTMTFTSPGKAALVADARYVGSFSTKTNTFQWAWKTIGEAEPVAKLRAFGEIRGIKQLTTPNFDATESDGWTMASVAAYLLGADTLYRPPADHLYWYVLLSNWRRKPKRRPRATS